MNATEFLPFCNGASSSRSPMRILTFRFNFPFTFTISLINWSVAVGQSGVFGTAASIANLPQTSTGKSRFMYRSESL